jgi:hypothetical protein
MIFIDNKYTKCYYRIILRAQFRTDLTDTYIEKHHIIPKSLGGSNRKDNLVKLTAREHFICHRLLPKMTFGSYKKKMLYAQNMMLVNAPNQHRHKVNSNVYKHIKEEWNKINPFNDKDWQKEHASRQKNKLVSSETRQKLSNAWTEERRQLAKERNLLIQSLKTVKPKTIKKSLIKYRCQYCNTNFDPGNFSQFHGENCPAKHGLLTNKQKAQHRRKKERSVSIDNTVYSSLTEASKHTGLHICAIVFRATKSKNYPTYFLLEQ